MRAAEKDPGNLSDEHALTLMTAEGELLTRVAELADQLRRDTVGDEVTYVVNRNINFTNVCYVGCRFCAFAQRRNDADAYSLSLDQVADRAQEAWDLGATEVCMQGGIDPELPGTAYFDLASAVKKRVPDMHVHAFSPMEIVNGSSRTGLSFEDFLIKARESGLGSIPGTAAEILDDEVRWVLTKGKLPTRTWIDVVSTAHRVGLPSSSTMMYGHVDNPRHWVQHLRVLSRIQDETGGFTEFVPLPFVHHSAPIYLAGVARPGPTLRDNVAVHAVARILLHGRIDNIQTSWVKLGVEGTQAMLRAGANDLGGTLMEETISRMAGSEHGSAKTVEELVAIGAGIGRPVAQRTTTYGSSRCRREQRRRDRVRHEACVAVQRPAPPEDEQLEHLRGGHREQHVRRPGKVDTGTQVPRVGEVASVVGHPLEARALHLVVQASHGGVADRGVPDQQQHRDHARCHLGGEPSPTADQRPRILLFPERVRAQLRRHRPGTFEGLLPEGPDQAGLSAEGLVDGLRRHPRCLRERGHGRGRVAVRREQRPGRQEHALASRPCRGASAGGVVPPRLDRDHPQGAHSFQDS